jgi:NADH-quinone oxidoreductase subunit C
MAQGEGTPTPPEGEQPTQQRPEEAEPEGQAQPEDPSTIPDTQPSGEKPGGGGTAAPTAGDAPKTEEGALAVGEKAQEASEPAAKEAAATATAAPAKAARPAKAEVKPPEPERPPPGSIADTFKQVLPDLTFDAFQGMTNVIIEVQKSDVATVAQAAKDDARLDLNFLRVLFGVDHEADGMEVLYELLSLEKGHTVTLKTKLPPDDLKVASVASVWNAADWHERETRDMFGIEFEGHPHLVPLLLPEDMTDHFPLRKDNPLAEIEEWQGELLGEEMGSAGHIPSGSKYANVGASAEGEE